MLIQSRWPLLIDPQGIALKWIHRIEKLNDVSSIGVYDDKFMRCMENSVQYGYPGAKTDDSPSFIDNPCNF